MTLGLFSLALLALLQLQGILVSADPYKEAPIQFSVINEVDTVAPVKYTALIRPGGILLGAMKRLQNAKKGFTYSVTYNDDYGFYLESVNGVAGNNADHTYWQILSDVNGTPTPTPVGVGCYIPKANEHIIFKFTKWCSQVDGKGACGH